MERRCPRCGTPYEEGDRFCRRCGAGLLKEDALSKLAREYESKLVDKPNDPNLRYNLALAYRHMRLLDLACEELRKVMGLFPDFSDAYFDLVGILCDLGDLEGAKEILAQAEGKFPQDERIPELRRRLFEGCE